MSMVCVGFLILFKCSPVGGVADAATFCANAKPIYWHAGDTRKTKEQADAHNAVGRALCGWGKK